MRLTKAGPKRNDKHPGGSAILKAALILLACGFLLSICTLVAMNQFSRETASADSWNKLQTYGTPDKPFQFYLFYCGYLVCIGLAGVLEFFSPEARRVRSQHSTWLFGLVCYLTVSFITTCRTFSFSDWLSKKAFHPSGFAGAAIVIIVFCAVTEAAWPWIDRLFQIVGGILSALVVYLMLTNPAKFRWEGVQFYTPYLNPLFWFAAWVMLAGNPFSMKNEVVWTKYSGTRARC